MRFCIIAIALVLPAAAVLADSTIFAFPADTSDFGASALDSYSNGPKSQSEAIFKQMEALNPKDVPAISKLGRKTGGNESAVWPVIHAPYDIGSQAFGAADGRKAWVNAMLSTLYTWLLIEPGNTRIQGEITTLRRVRVMEEEAVPEYPPGDYNTPHEMQMRGEFSR